MDIQPQTTKPISDDQELAKVLAGVTQTPSTTFGVGGVTTDKPVATSSAIPNLIMTDPINPETPVVMPDNSVSNNNQPEYNAITPEASNSSDLEEIKKQALIELRPLVDKLDLEPEEKFDIYLLLLRSTDDKTLIDPAHKTATEIADESKRAQALLDIIKEIDYLSTPTTES
jgi:hypothetical protein